MEVSLIEYKNGTVTTITEPERYSLYKSTCHLTLTATLGTLTATIQHDTETQTLTTDNSQLITHNPQLITPFGGILIQHTGSTGASATVINGLKNIYLEK